MNKLSKMARYKINMQKLVVFLNTTSEQCKQEIQEDNCICNSIRNNNILRNRFNHIDARCTPWKLQNLLKVKV